MLIPDINFCRSNFNADALVRLVLPRGLRFCTQHEVGDLPARCHAFVVTKEDGEKNYGVAIVFYEEVNDSNICHAVHTLQKMYSTEAAEGGTLKRADRLRPRSAAQAKVTSERSRSLPRHYQQSRLTSASSNLDLSAATYDYRNDTLYATKGVAVLLSEPLAHAATAVLTAMHKYVGNEEFDLGELEGLINNLLHDVPLPNPGRSVRFSCLGEQLTISMPKTPQELPLFDFNLLDFFDMLGIDNALKLFVCALLEHQVRTLLTYVRCVFSSYALELRRTLYICSSDPCVLFRLGQANARVRVCVFLALPVRLATRLRADLAAQPGELS